MTSCTPARQDADNSSIQLFTQARIERIEGSIGDFKTSLGQRERPPRSSTEGHRCHRSAGIRAQGVPVRTRRKGPHPAGTEARLAAGGGLPGADGTLEDRGDDPVRRFAGQRAAYCSRLCCAEAIKNALKIKEVSPLRNVYVLYRDIRTYGFRESYYTRRGRKVSSSSATTRTANPRSRKTAKAAGGRLRPDSRDALTMPPTWWCSPRALGRMRTTRTIAQFLKVPLKRKASSSKPT